MNISELIKKSCLCFALMLPAAAASAADGGVTVASIDRSVSARLQNMAQPVITEKYEYYTIEGSCETDLRCQRQKKGVVWSDGMTYDSATSWDVTWHYGYGQSPLGCSTDNFQVSVEITYHYPKWIPGRDAPQALVEKWDRYMKHLTNHEKGHRDLAVEAAVQLARAVAALPPVSSCAQVDRYVKALCRERMSMLNEEEKEYDTTTGHGSKQGAVFP